MDSPPPGRPRRDIKHVVVDALLLVGMVLAAGIGATVLFGPSAPYAGYGVGLLLSVALRVVLHHRR